VRTEKGKTNIKNQKLTSQLEVEGEKFTPNRRAEEKIPQKIEVAQKNRLFAGEASEKKGGKNIVHDKMKNQTGKNAEKVRRGRGEEKKKLQHPKKNLEKRKDIKRNLSKGWAFSRGEEWSGGDTEGGKVLPR